MSRNSNKRKSKIKKKLEAEKVEIRMILRIYVIARTC